MLSTSVGSIIFLPNKSANRYLISISTDTTQTNEDKELYKAGKAKYISGASIKRKKRADYQNRLLT